MVAVNRKDPAQLSGKHLDQPQAETGGGPLLLADISGANIDHPPISRYTNLPKLLPKDPKGFSKA